MFCAYPSPIWKRAGYTPERFFRILPALQADRHAIQAPLAMPAGAENANSVLLAPSVWQTQNPLCSHSATYTSV